MHSPEGIERVGFILNDGTLIELPNISPKPDISFQVRGEDIMKYVLSGQTFATWHTHPKKDGNLTMEDHEMFKNYPELVHLIIGTDGLRSYKVKNGRVVNA